MKIVADRSRTEPGNFFQTLMVRKALVESGRFKTYADLKGLKVALLGQGGSPSSTLNEALKRGGLIPAGFGLDLSGYDRLFIRPDGLKQRFMARLWEWARTRQI